MSTIRALAAAVDARDPYTQFHSKNVSDLASKLAKKINLPKEKIRKIEMAGLLHDIGKIGIPDSILKKSVELSIAEKKIIKEHPVLGEKILKTTKFKEILPWVRSHHERWDGNGYPDSLGGEKIPVEARILAIADAFDAMTSKRPYRNALSAEEVIEELKRQKRKQFDPYLVDALLELVLEGGVKLKHTKESKKEENKIL